MHSPQPVNAIIKHASKSKRMTMISVAIAALIGLSACGIKGDLKRPAPIFKKNKTQAPTPPNATPPNTTQEQVPTQTVQPSNPGKA